MGIKTSGFEEFSRDFDKLRKNIKNLNGTHESSFDELFNAAFMRKYTRSSSFNEFLEKSGFKVTSQDEFESIPDAEWNRYIVANSKFPNWNSMQQAAVDQHAARLLETAMKDAFR